jgi:high-affinity iron transporter
MFANAFIITWRESLEALLVVGILLAWANTQVAAAAYRRYVLWGVVGGVAWALAVAAGAVAARELLSGDALDIFQIVLLFATWALITQMVLWMHGHAGSLRAHLQSQAASATSEWGVALVAAFAVAREGIETVMFLFGAFVQAQGNALAALAGGMLCGLALACVTASLAVRGARRLRLAWVFRISEILLLAIACSMLANGIDRVLGRDWLAMLANPVWDTSTWLDDTHGVGGVLADFAGYRAQPSGLWLIAFGVYAAYIGWWMWRQPRGAR